MSKKEFLKGKCNQLLFGWECPVGWYKFAHVVELFIMDAFVDMFITLCIVINTAFMAFEQDGMDLQMETTLQYGNYVSCTLLVLVVVMILIICQTLPKLLFITRHLLYSLMYTLKAAGSADWGPWGAHL